MKWVISNVAKPLETVEVTFDTKGTFTLSGNKSFEVYKDLKKMINGTITVRAAAPPKGVAFKRIRVQGSSPEYFEEGLMNLGFVFRRQSEEQGNP